MTPPSNLLPDFFSWWVNAVGPASLPPRPSSFSIAIATISVQALIFFCILFQIPPNQHGRLSKRGL